MKNPKGVKAFGVHVRQLRELADLADVSKKTIQRIENEESAASVDVLICIAPPLNVSLSELVNFNLPKEKRK